MVRIREWKHLTVVGVTTELKVDIVFNIFFCSLGMMVQDDVVGFACKVVVFCFLSIFVCVVFSTNKDNII